MGAATLNGKIYLVGVFIGGAVHNDGQNAAMEYDPSLDTWRITSVSSKLTISRRGFSARTDTSALGESLTFAA